MAKKDVLVVYATRYGSTKEIAEEIASVLRSLKRSVDIFNALDLPSPAGYRLVICTSPLYMGKILVDLAEYARSYESILSKMPVALFLSGISLNGEGTAGVMAAGQAAEALHSSFIPCKIGFFGGRLEYSRLSAPDRDIAIMGRMPESKEYNRDQIRRWAEEVSQVV